MVQRLAEIALDRAQPHDHVRPRLDGLGRIARVLVGKRIHRHLRKLRLDLLRDVVHERQHAARRAALGVVNGLAVGALARAVAVVLRHRNDLGIRRLAQPFLHALHHEVPQLRVGQAELRVLVRALAVDEAVPLGMRAEMLLRRHERIEGMREALVLDAAAQGFGNAVRSAIGDVVEPSSAARTPATRKGRDTRIRARSGHPNPARASSGEREWSWPRAPTSARRIAPARSDTRRKACPAARPRPATTGHPSPS